jgi:hypothetical protein
MVDRDPLPSWGSEPSWGAGRVTLLGDAAELAAFDQAYRATTLPDVTALNSRPSLTP